MSAPEKTKNGNGSNGHTLATTKQPKKRKKAGRKPKVTAEMKKAIIEAVARGLPIELQCLALDIKPMTLAHTLQRDREFRKDVACARVRLCDELVGKLKAGDRAKDYSRLPWLMSKLFRDFSDKPPEPTGVSVTLNQSIEAGKMIFDNQTLKEIRAAEAEADALNHPNPNAVPSKTSRN